jgi:predicted ATPase
MSKCRIYLSGAHSTGKTTILNDLKSHLNICFEEEIARKVIRQFMWERDEFMPDTNPKNFLKLNEEILRQQIQIDERYRHASEGNVIIVFRLNVFTNSYIFTRFCSLLRVYYFYSSLYLYKCISFQSIFYF